MNLRRPAALLAVTALSGALVFATGTAAFAAPVTISIGGYSFSADDSNIAAGATVTNYTGGPVATIPSTVTIGANTYDVTSIGYLAFFNKGLTSVIIPDTVTSVGDYAFYTNGLLTSVTFGNSVTTIGELAFSGNGLTSVTIPDSVTTIAYGAFDGNDIASATIGSSVISIGENAFARNDLTSVIIPDSVTTIGFSAFAENDLTSVTIGNSVTTIGGYAFYTSDLTSVTIPDSVTSIGDFAFYGNALTSVIVGNSVTSIGERAFYLNPALASVSFLGATPTSFGERVVGASLGDGTGLTVYYNWAFDEARAAGGFTAPTWQGYNSVQQANVVFSMGGRGTAPANQTVNVGSLASEPVAPTSTGALFTGWYTDAALTTKADFAGAVTSNITLFAGWTALAETGADITPMTIVVPGLLVVVGLGLILLGRRKARTGE